MANCRKNNKIQLIICKNSCTYNRGCLLFDQKEVAPESSAEKRMEGKTFIFLAGLHRSGTSLLHEIIREHPSISGFSGTGVPEDEGQHLQSVYAPANVYGGAGKFAFDSRSYMDESHPLATGANAEKILREWSEYGDLSCGYFVEKSPPNIIRTRFLQKLYPNSKFIAILRHPLAIAYATKKWSKTSHLSVLKHTLLAYDIFRKDVPSLKSVYIIHYEDFVLNPQKCLDRIYRFLGVESIQVEKEVRSDVNEKYFAMWNVDRKKLINRFHLAVSVGLEKKANMFGYSINNYADGLVETASLLPIEGGF